MKTKLKYLYFSLFSLVLASCGITENKEVSTLNGTNATPKRIVTIGGTITEITSALGFEKNIVATDKTSTYPASIQKLPSLGYRNNIKAEGIIQMQPNLVLAQEGYLDPSVCNQLEESGLTLIMFNHKVFTIEKTKQLITKLGIVLDAEDKALGLVHSITKDMKTLQNLPQKTPKPKVLFIYARGNATQNIGGYETFASSIIELAGGEMAVKEVNGFKPLTTEALIKANPDYLLFFDTGLESLGGSQGVLAIPGVKQTTAGNKENFIAMDGLLLSGFGPRVGKAILQLRKMIYPAIRTANHALLH